MLNLSNIGINNVFILALFYHHPVKFTSAFVSPSAHASPHCRLNPSGQRLALLPFRNQAKLEDVAGRNNVTGTESSMA